MKKVLIITSSYDITVDYLIDKFSDSASFYRFNTNLFSDYCINITESDGWSIRNKHWEIKKNQISAIYYRKPSFPNIENYHVKYHRMMQKDILTLIQGIAESYNGKCLSKPSILSKAENKIYQLSVANEIGFNTPHSLISNSSAEVSKFCSNLESIVKPLSVGKIYYEDKIGIIQTNLVSNHYNIEHIELSPAYFQEYIQKDYEARVTIVGNNIFSVKITSDEKVDWRKSGSKNVYSKISLPSEIELKCLRMLDILNLKFGAFDFIVNDNNYYFLEVNPNGQWYWLEEALNLNISDCIFDYLVGD